MKPIKVYVVVYKNDSFSGITIDAIFFMHDLAELHRMEMQKINPGCDFEIQEYEVKQ